MVCGVLERTDSKQIFKEQFSTLGGCGSGRADLSWEAMVFLKEQIFNRLWEAVVV